MFVVKKPSGSLCTMLLLKYAVDTVDSKKAKKWQYPRENKKINFFEKKLDKLERLWYNI